MSDTDLLSLLVALSVLLLSVHALGTLAERLRQPRMTGELGGGLILGPTVLGALAPQAHGALFPDTGPVATAFGAIEHLGMLMLMFLAGAEVRRLLPRENRRVTAWIVVLGLAVPFGVGLAALQVVDLGGLAGPAADPVALSLVVASAIAVTSIPVISRIMLDLGILGTSFGGVVLASAVAEDVVLYVVIAVALGLAHAHGDGLTGLPGLLGIDSVPAMSAYYVLTTVALFVCMLTVVPRLAAAALHRAGKRSGGRAHTPGAAGVTGVLLVVVCAAGASLLGVQPMFGAFLAGVLAARIEEASGAAIAGELRAFALAFFIPLYFGSIGLGLDLGRDLLLGFTVLFIALACAVKLASVYAGARLGGEAPGGALNLAFAMNARGGPGIALAWLAYEAGIVNAQLFTTLIVLAVVTSVMAGAWLRRVLARGRPLRETSRTAGP
ncbi:cation:proton antiporter [Nocardiopsis suaedae]|uniref:Cation:proton antiporter n=1 Tax=Nocardiopsis suaedae TaxID=3018444 RepID=A0ABT4TJY2_9ACTN|nr:cation:proton antiporter [Nocardiopsis suaedae]MDA2804975.1 cation:proton antiporter [Nocardiopsis suaedae]